MPSSALKMPPRADVLADASYLFALVVERHAGHGLATAWFDRQRAGFRLRICRMVQVSFLRLLTHPAAMGGDPLAPAEAWGLYAGLLADPHIGFHHEPPGLARAWIGLAAGSSAPAGTSYLAAFALRSGLSVVTFDAAFAAIPGLTTEVLGA